MIIEKTFTIETRLDQKQNQKIIDYIREFNVLYGKALRFAWHRYNNGGHFDRKNQNLILFCRKSLTSAEEWQVPLSLKFKALIMPCEN